MKSQTFWCTFIGNCYANYFVGLDLNRSISGAVSTILFWSRRQRKVNLDISVHFLLLCILSQVFDNLRINWQGRQINPDMKVCKIGLFKFYLDDFVFTWFFFSFFKNFLLLVDAEHEVCNHMRNKFGKNIKHFKKKTNLLNCILIFSSTIYLF